MAMARIYSAEVLSIAEAITDAFTIEFASTGRGFKYQPGQFLHLALDEYDPSMGWPESRCFSMQSSPDEEVLRITYAIKGRYTERMADEMKVGSRVQLKLPFGNLFSREHSRRNTVFLAGGTGITPFLSLLTAPSFAEYETPCLHAGFRDKGANLYQDELERAKAINPGLHAETYYQDTDGILDIERIYNSSDKETSFFISGPPTMIRSMKEYLVAQGLNADQLRTDDWE